MTKTAYTRWTCDNLDCDKWADSAEGFKLPVGPWITDGEMIYCSRVCRDADQKNWYDDLCVKVTLADVVADGGLFNRNRLDNGPIRMYSFEENSRDQAYRRLINNHWNIGVCRDDGRAYKKNEVGDSVTSSPDSIVRLVCPTFAEACEHPEDFVTMANAARFTHKHLSDVAKWNAMVGRMRLIYEAFGKSLYISITNCVSHGKAP